MLGIGLGLTTIRGAGGVAALSLDFLSGSLDSRITFTRGSTGTYFNSSGVLSSAAINTPRFDYDPVTLAPKGLLIEEARTNLLTYSEQFDNAAWFKGNATVTANSTTAPDGSATADKLVEDAANSPHYASGSATTTAATHAFSCYIKAAERSFVLLWNSTANFGRVFDLGSGTVSGTVAGVTQATADIANVGNGWYRCTIYGTCTAASNSFRAYTMTDATTFTYTGTAGSGIYLWGAQLEAGAFATSYIPTVASTVTRSADVATMTGTNFSSWYNQSAGTFVSGFDVVSTATASKAILAVNDGTSNNLNIVYVSSGAGLFSEIRSSGSTQATLGGNTIIPNVVAVNATAYKANDFAAVLNGGAASTDTLGAVPVGPTAMNIGYSSNYGGLYLNGHIRQIAYYNTRLPDAQLQALTA